MPSIKCALRVLYIKWHVTRKTRIVFMQLHGTCGHAPQCTVIHMPMRTLPRPGACARTGLGGAAGWRCMHAGAIGVMHAYIMMCPQRLPAYADTRTPRPAPAAHHNRPGAGARAREPHGLLRRCHLQQLLLCVVIILRVIAGETTTGKNS